MGNEWMKQFDFLDIFQPIHDSIFPNSKFVIDEKRHRQIFDAIDHDKDGLISKREWLKATLLSSDECVIPIQRIHQIFEQMANDNDNGICFAVWLKFVCFIPQRVAVQNEKLC